MNEQHVTFLIRQIRTYLDELESEIRNHPENYTYTSDLYNQVRMYEEWNDDDGYPD